MMNCALYTSFDEYFHTFCFCICRPNVNNSSGYLIKNERTRWDWKPNKNNKQIRIDKTNMGYFSMMKNENIWNIRSANKMNWKTDLFSQDKKAFFRSPNWLKIHKMLSSQWNKAKTKFFLSPLKFSHDNLIQCNEKQTKLYGIQFNLTCDIFYWVVINVLKD